MFESTGWVLEEPDVPEHSNYEILTPTIVKPRKTANIDVDDVHVSRNIGTFESSNTRLPAIKAVRDAFRTPYI